MRNGKPLNVTEVIEENLTTARRGMTPGGWMPGWALRQFQVDPHPIRPPRRRQEFVLEIRIARTGTQLGFWIQKQFLHSAVLIKLQEDPEAAQIIAGRGLALPEGGHVLVNKFLAHALIKSFAFRCAEVAVDGSACCQKAGSLLSGSCRRPSKQTQEAQRRNG